MSGWTELFRGKSSVYALDEVSKEWVDRGISGQLTMFQKNGYTSDIRIKWTKNQTDRWWRLMNGKLKPKGERAWVLKAHDASDNKQEILAIRFSDVQLSQQFAAKFHQIFPPQQAMPSSPMNVNMQMPAQPYPQSPPQPYFNQFPPQQGGMAMNGMMGGGMMNGMMMAGGMMGGGMMMGQGGAMHNPPMMYTGPPAGGGGGGGTWECAVCTYSNEASRASCIMCGLSQDSTHKAQQGQQDARQRSLTGDPSSPQQQQQMGQGRGSAFNFGDHALSQIKGQNSQQRILSQFEMNQLNASAITSPHVKARRNSWICPMCTLHNATSPPQAQHAQQQQRYPSHNSQTHSDSLQCHSRSFLDSRQPQGCTQHNATSLSRCAACNTNREVNNNNKGQQQQEMRPIHPQMSQPMMPHFSVSVAQPVKYNMNEMHAMMANMNAGHGSRQAQHAQQQQRYPSHHSQTHSDSLQSHPRSFFDSRQPQGPPQAQQQQRYPSHHSQTHCDSFQSHSRSSFDSRQPQGPPQAQHAQQQQRYPSHNSQTHSDSLQCHSRSFLDSRQPQGCTQHNATSLSRCAACN
eukprot:1128133_1